MSQATTDRNMYDERFVLIPLGIMFLLWGIGLIHWLNTGDSLTAAFFAYIGMFAGAGVGSYIVFPDRQRHYARRFMMMMLGSLLLVLAFLTNHGNMQIEGLFFALLAGTGPWVILHYLIAKIAGPLIFGRVWCGWACWYGMIFDLLPYPQSRYRHGAGWSRLRYVHFAISLLIVALLWFGFGYSGIISGVSGLAWFAGGLMFYYLLGIGLAFWLKDNRAFCKYLCPIAVPLKVTSRFALVKVAAITTEHCTYCETCVEMCPMNIRVKDYITQDKRVLSTECTLCQTCIHVCPKDALQLSVGLDAGAVDILDFDPSRGNRDHRATVQSAAD